MQIDRIQLNAAIDQLIDSKGASEDSRQLIYQFGLSLPPMSRVAGSLQMEKPGDSFTGHTQEHGDVQIQSDQDEVKKLEFGGEPARIGSYKVWREKSRGGKFGIAIGHFWKLDQTTQSETEEAQAWSLTCDKNGPVWFGERGTLTVFDHFGFCLKRHFIVESWGEHPGKRHHAGWALQLTI
jgi:hypothetical protein